MKLENFRRSNTTHHTSTTKLTHALFAIYLLALCWILLFKLGVQFSYMGNRNVNLIPFRELLTSTGKLDVAEIIMNVVIFVPLGIYTGVSFNRWSFGYKLLFCFLISVLFEGLQYILRIGAFDITDIINNTLGGIVGLIVFEIIEKIFNNRIRAQKFINTIAAIGTALMISLLVLLKLNMLPVRYQ
jgi:glycopeptide antibiotics resistance protein